MRGFDLDPIFVVFFVLAIPTAFFLHPVVMGDVKYNIEIIKQDDKVVQLETKIVELQKDIESKDTELNYLKSQTVNYSWIGWFGFASVIMVCLTYILTRPKQATMEEKKEAKHD